MSRDGRQRERERERERETDGDRSGGSGRSQRATVSDRTSWSGLAKRAYNVALGSNARSRRSSGGGSTLKLAGLTLLGAFVGGLLPLPLTWLVGIGVGAAVGGRTGNGSAVAAAGIGGVVGFLSGLGFAPAFFGLGFILTLLLTVVSAVVAGVGYLAGE